MKPLTLYIAVGEQGSVTANIITYSRNLIREGAVIDVVIEMDHTVSLSGLCEKLLDPAVREAPVILCVGYVVQDGKVVGEIAPRIAVKRIVSDQSPYSGGIRGFHRFYIPLRVIFLHTAVHSSRNKLNISVNQLRQQNHCDEDTAPKQTEQAASFFRFLAGRAECPSSSFFHRPQSHDHKDSQDTQKKLCQSTSGGSRGHQDRPVNDKACSQNSSLFEGNPLKRRNHDRSDIACQRGKCADPPVCRI